MKKVLWVLTVISFFLVAMTGCSNEAEPNVPQNGKNTSEETEYLSPETQADKTTGTIEETIAGAPETSNEIKTTDTGLKYKINEEGNVVITSYIGNDENIVVPKQIEGKDVVEIESNAFYRKLSLVSVTLPNTVKRIKSGAFAYCTALISINIPESVAEIYPGAFSSCLVLSGITLPENLKYLGTEAFADCKALKQIVLPASLERWDSAVFQHSGLETAVISQGLKKVPSSTFCDTPIKEVTIPSSIEEIELFAFNYCENLEQVVLNEGLIKIDSAFQFCGSLREIIIPSTVTSLEEITFKGCNSLGKIMFEGNAPDVFENKDEVLELLKKTCTIYYHEGATGFTAPEWFGYQTEIW